MYTWGWNEHGMCGQGHEDNIYRPTLVSHFSSKNNKVFLIGSGAGHSMAVCQRKSDPV